MTETFERAKIGWISPEFHGKKTLCFDVKISKEGMFCCNKRQDIAQIMSMLARIMEKLGIDEDEPLSGIERIFELERDENGHKGKGTNSKRNNWRA